MAKRSTPKDPEPAGDFQSRFITIPKSKLFSGGQYELVWAELIDGVFYDMIKNSAGEITTIEHAKLMQAKPGNTVTT